MSWILELDSGTYGLESRAEWIEPFLDTGHGRRGLVLVIPQLYTEDDIHGTESLVGKFRVTCPVQSSTKVHPNTAQKI